MGLGKWLGISSDGAGSSLVGGLVNGAFNLIGQGQQYRNQRKLNDQQQEHALEQMAQEQEYTKEMWNMNNEYNDPSAVIARGRAAGLSPMAALGQSSGGAGISTMATGAGSVGSSAGGASGAGSNPVGDLLQGSVSAAQVRTAEAQAKVAEAEAKKIEAETKDIEWQNSLQTLKEEILRMGLRKDTADAIYQEFRNSKSEEEFNATMDNLRARTDLTNEQKEEVIAHANALKSQASWYDASADAQKSIIRLNDARVKTEDILRDLTAEEKRLANGVATQELGILRQGGAQEKLKQLFIATEQMQSEASISQAKAATAVIREWVEIGAIGIEAASELLSVFLPSKAVSDIIATMRKKPGKIGFNK